MNRRERAINEEGAFAFSDNNYNFNRWAGVPSRRVRLARRKRLKSELKGFTFIYDDDDGKQVQTKTVPKPIVSEIFLMPTAKPVQFQTDEPLSVWIPGSEKGIYDVVITMSLENMMMCTKEWIEEQKAFFKEIREVEKPVAPETPEVEEDQAAQVSEEE